MLILADRVRETTTVVGTNDATLLGAVTGFQSFAVVGNTNTCYYTIADNAGNWEVGIGTYSTSGPTLARTTVLSSSNAGLKVNFPAGTKDIFVTYPSEKSINLDESGYVDAGGSPNVSLNGNLTFIGTTRRITGDFSSATLANRVAFQTSTTNGNTQVGILPNGTGSTAVFQAYGSPDPTNSSRFLAGVNGNALVEIRADISGTGTYLPMTFQTGGSERLRITTGGNVGINTTTPQSLLHITGSVGPVASFPTLANQTVLTLENNFHARIAGVVPTDLPYELGMLAYGSGDTNPRVGLSMVPQVSAMIFATGSGSAAITERMRIDSSGNVGIGTTAPGRRLTVASTAQVVGVFVSSNATSTQVRILDVNAVETDGLTLYTDTTLSSVQSGTGSTLKALTFQTGGSERMRITSGGDVGIGTSTPGAKLQVSGTTYLSGDTFTLGSLELSALGTGDRVSLIDFVSSGTPLTVDYSARIIRNPGVNGSLTILNLGTGDFRLQATNAAPMIFDTSATERMRILADGKVGIGAAAPLANLSIGTNGSATATPTALLAYNSTGLGTTAGNMAYISEFGGSVSNNGRLLFATLRTANGSDWTTSAWRIQPAVDASFTAQGSNRGYLELAIGPSGPYTGVGLSGAGNATPDLIINNSGNVGVGTITPGGKLAVVTDANSAQWLAIRNNSSGSGASMGVLLGNDGNAAYGALSVNSSTNTTAPGGANSIVVGSFGSNHLTFVTSNTERARIDGSTGNFAIGMTATSNSANGKVTIFNTQSDGAQTIANAGLLFAQAGGFAQAGIYPIGSAGFAGSLVFTTAASKGGPDYVTIERMRISSAGVVGIGTASPDGSAKLDVAGNIVLTGQSTADQFIRVGSGRSGNGYSFIDLQGDTTYSNGLRLIRTNSGANSASNIEHRGTGALQMITQEAAPIVFYTTVTERMRITSGGAVGIGTASPTALLDVVGTPAPSGSQGLRVSDGTRVGLLQVTGSSYSYNGVGANEVLIYGGSGALSLLADGQPIKFCAGSAERMRITSAGNIFAPFNNQSTSLVVCGDGNSSNLGARVCIRSPITAGASLNYAININDSNTNTAGGQNLIAWSHNAEDYSAGNVRAAIGATIDGGGAGTLVFRTGGFGSQAERMRVTGSGDFYVATTGSVAVGYLMNASGFMQHCRPSGAAQSMTGFYNGGNVVGEIRTSTTATSYITSSDYRLKENIAPLINVLDKVKSLKPCTYTWKLNGNSGEGFLAHELAEICPDAVSGEKDELDENGEPRYQGVDYGKVTPLLTAALQEALKKIEELESRLAALESK